MNKLLIILFFCSNAFANSQMSYKVNFSFDCKNPNNRLSCDPNNFQNERVFGLTNKQALLFDGGYSTDSVCSKNHYNNDISNRWCHAYMTKAINK